MNDNMTKLLEKLAAKLGTTTEYLWGVLLRQARISSIVGSIQTLMVIVFGIVLYKLHKHLAREESRSMQSLYSRYEEAAAIPMIIATIMFAICAIACFCSFQDIFNGFFDPEYWALDKVLEKLN